MAVDVVMVNYHTMGDAIAFCDSFGKNTFRGCTLTVVDVEGGGANFPCATTTITTGENIGYGAACNRGATLGTNDVILLANADTLLNQTFRECYLALTGPLGAYWGVLGPRQVNEHNHITAGGIFGHPKSPAQRAWNELDQGQVSDIRDDVLSVSGALYFIKRSVWKELTECPITQQYQPGVKGAFLETKHYFEEMTCSLHARGHGYKCVYYGPAKMLHYWHRASSHGGWADQQFAESQHMHREFCALHNLECE